MAFPKRRFELRTEQARESAIVLIRNLPLHDSKPMTVTVEEFRKPRKNEQNALMWSGPLKDISEQAFLEGRQYSAEVWSHYLKVQLLPEECDPELCLAGYEKWDYDPAGERVLVGSTTKLTVKGFAQHLEAIYAFGASLGVNFSESPRGQS